MHDSRIGNPKFRNRKLDCQGLPKVQFTISKFRVSNAGIVHFRDLRFPISVIGGIVRSLPRTFVR